MRTVVVITASELFDRDRWDAFCALRGINPWAVNEGLMESSEEFTLTEEEIETLGFGIFGRSGA